MTSRHSSGRSAWSVQPVWRMFIWFAALTSFAGQLAAASVERWGVFELELAGSPMVIRS
jgi:hypothetical protein